MKDSTGRETMISPLQREMLESLLVFLGSWCVISLLGWQMIGLPWREALLSGLTFAWFVYFFRNTARDAYADRCLPPTDDGNEARVRAYRRAERKAGVVFFTPIFLVSLLGWCPFGPSWLEALILGLMVASVNFIFYAVIVGYEQQGAHHADSQYVR